MGKSMRYLVVLMVFGMFCGCEWESSSDGDSWNDAYSWVNFSGVYRPTGGNSFVVLSFTPPGGTPASTATRTDTIGTGALNVTSFSGNLNQTPIVPGTVTVNGDAMTLTDNGLGELSGQSSPNIVHTGSINYDTGAISVTFGSEVTAGLPVRATYVYAVAGTSGDSTAGTSNPIDSITVSQTGQRLSFVDSNGVSYSGNISSVSQGGGDSSGLTSGTVVANFRVTASNGARITGTLQGDYTAPGVTADGTAAGNGTLASRVMQGTYAQGGSTADVLGAAGSVDVTVTATGTAADTDS